MAREQFPSQATANRNGAIQVNGVKVSDDRFITAMWSAFRAAALEFKQYSELPDQTKFRTLVNAQVQETFNAIVQACGGPQRTAHTFRSFFHASLSPEVNEDGSRMLLKTKLPVSKESLAGPADPQVLTWKWIARNINNYFKPLDNGEAAYKVDMTLADSGVITVKNNLL